MVVLDYGSGNVRSAVRALEKVGSALDSHEVSIRLTADRAAAVAADGLVVPGVGAFAACMAGLGRVDAAGILAERLADARPVLGICVGMQVLFADGIEHGVHTDGLGLLPGRVQPLRAPVVPHMGWNTVTPPAGSVLFEGIEPGTRFYFVHSYAVPAPDPASPYLATLTEHGDRFVAAAEHGVLSATQFHPEKSGAAGQALLRNWIRSVAARLAGPHPPQASPPARSHPASNENIPAEQGES
ncbi:imidazole glycerol phosphate synthase subunit HisH [Jatrophihabitans telluris]|uniref:imidazole glycerol phosphate synthase subunit HisH n=1 Tax=Jatrophihabitans telluris TaxID=2038343 RepID=UPI003D31AF76